MKPQFETVCSEYASLWKSLVVRPQRLREVQSTARRIQAERSRYEKVAAATTVPWFVVGLIHAMEAGLSFVDHLHNGDPLTERTVHVPRGRPVKGDPPFTWEESAIDALGYDGLANVTNWCVERIAYELESYNGWGYRTKGINTPYLWSATNQYTSGKYVQDGVYDPKAVSGQSGAMAILSVLKEIEPSIVLTYFDGKDAEQEPGDIVSAAGTVSKPQSTIKADLVTVGSSAGIATVMVAHNNPDTGTTPPPATAAPAAPPVAAVPAPSAAPAPAQPASTPPVSPPVAAAPANPPPQSATPAPAPAAAPTHVAPAPAQVKPAPHLPTKTVTSTVQATRPPASFIDNHYALLLGGLFVLLLVGIFLSWRARNALARSNQKFAKAVPELLSRAASGGDIASAPLVKNMRARALTAAWIVGTIIVNVIALAKFLQYFHLAPSDWYPPFLWLGVFYDDYAQQGFHIVSNTVYAQFGISLLQWPWLLPLIVLYVSTASAFMVANLGLMQHDTSAQTLWGAVIHAGWLLAVPTFIMDALRYRVVTRFARQNTVLFFAYLIAFVGSYVGARFINDEFLAAYVQQHPNVAAAVLQHVENGVKVGQTVLR